MCKVHHSYCTEREGRPAERTLEQTASPVAAVLSMREWVSWASFSNSA
jgi:hypothetical protein